jgi:hypothetical protein
MVIKTPYHWPKTYMKINCMEWIYDHLIFKKALKAHIGKKESLFNKWYWENWIFTCRRPKLDPYLSLHKS